METGNKRTQEAAHLLWLGEWELSYFHLRYSQPGEDKHCIRVW